MNYLGIEGLTVEDRAKILAKTADGQGQEAGKILYSTASHKISGILEQLAQTDISKAADIFENLTEFAKDNDVSYKEIIATVNHDVLTAIKKELASRQKAKK